MDTPNLQPVTLYVHEGAQELKALLHEQTVIVAANLCADCGVGIAILVPLSAYQEAREHDQAPGPEYVLHAASLVRELLDVSLGDHTQDTPTTRDALQANAKRN